MLQHEFAQFDHNIPKFACVNTSWPDHVPFGNPKTILARSCKASREVEATPWFNRQGQAHIVSTAIPLPRSCKASREVEATLWFRTWLSIDPQPASISPTINISIVFICAFPVDCGPIICHTAIKNDSSAILITGRTHRHLILDSERSVLFLRRLACQNQAHSFPARAF